MPGIFHVGNGVGCGWVSWDWVGFGFHVGKWPIPFLWLFKSGNGLVGDGIFEGVGCSSDGAFEVCVLFFEFGDLWVWCVAGDGVCEDVEDGCVEGCGDFVE